MQHVVAVATHMGRSHSVNQDAGGVWTWRGDDERPISLALVADGVSSGKTSQEASKLAVGTMQLAVEEAIKVGADLDGLVETLTESGYRAGEQIALRPHESLRSADATTLAGVVLSEREGAAVWCGDSRVYRVRGKEITCLTTDHSWSQEVVESGLMDEEQASRDPRARMITRWLGPPADGDKRLEAFRFSAEPSETFLCCSDGLYMYFCPPLGSPAEMVEILNANDGDLGQAVTKLVDNALDRGGQDDITVAALNIH